MSADRLLLLHYHHKEVVNKDEDSRYGRFAVVVATSKEPQLIQSQLEGDSDVQTLAITPFESGEAAGGEIITKEVPANMPQSGLRQKNGSKVISRRSGSVWNGSII